MMRPLKAHTIDHRPRWKERKSLSQCDTLPECRAPPHRADPTSIDSGCAFLITRRKYGTGLGETIALRHRERGVASLSGVGAGSRPSMRWSAISSPGSAAWSGLRRWSMASSQLIARLALALENSPQVRQAVRNTENVAANDGPHTRDTGGGFA